VPRSVYASQQSGATAVSWGPTSRSLPGHDFSVLLRPGLKSFGLGPVQLPPGNQWLPGVGIAVEVQEIGIISSLISGFRPKLVKLCR